MASAEKKLFILAQEVLEFLEVKDSFIEVNLVKSAVMRSLNRKFRGKNFSTNILSFEAPKAFPKLPKASHRRFLGEIYLDSAYIRRKGENIEHLLIHGVLHLLGFEHERYDDRIKMARLEKKLLRWQKIRF